jgi:hypothetical protein
MLNLNDKVIVKSDNVFGKNVGTVKGIFDADYYYSLYPSSQSNLDETWTLKFPEWKSKCVAIVLFQVSVKIASEEEWISNSLRKGITHASYSMCPSTNFMAFPIDDLERIIL